MKSSALHKYRCYLYAIYYLAMKTGDDGRLQATITNVNWSGVLDFVERSSLFLKCLIYRKKVLLHLSLSAKM
jgi:hypothetical protein